MPCTQYQKSKCAGDSWYNLIVEYNKLASKESIEKTTETLKERGFQPVFVENKEQALAKLKELIPAGVSIMNGTSRTLEEIGLIDYLKAGDHGWNNLHDAVVKEDDPVKRSLLRRQAVVSDYYIGSVHALSENGEIIIASNSGSQLPHIVFTSPNIIFVVGAQKIVSDLSEAQKRLEEYVIPLEDKRMLEASQGVYGTALSKELILRYEKMGRKVLVIIVNEALGF